MPDPVYYLNEQDALILKRLLDQEARNPGRLPHVDQERDPEAMPDVYVAVPPCGEGIPARSGTKPGVAACCIFKLVAPGSTNAITGYTYNLVPVLEKGTGQPVRQMVYNVYDVAVPPLLPPNEKYIVVEKDRFGRWLNEPWLSASGSTSTTTTPGCHGACQWNWDSVKGCWTFINNSCLQTTTTTTTTINGGSTTTTASCLCPGSGSTTTTNACSNCFYPDFCGNAPGQCTFTSCTWKTTPPPTLSCNCSTTTTTTTTPSGTTTTCNCATTSTAGHCNTPGCGTTTTNSGGGGGCNSQCIWNVVNGQWTLTCQGCDSCPSPSGTLDPCSAYVSYCFNTTTPGCSGKCGFNWYPPGGYWNRLSSTCAAVSNCSCDPPSFTGSSCDISAPAYTGCTSQNQSTTTTSHPTTTTTPIPCVSCYTTTTTTTTPPSCTGNCLWTCPSINSWSLVSNSCSNNCNCDQPAVFCFAPCDVRATDCHTTTSTTTTSTTTTQTTSTTSTTTTTSSSTSSSSSSSTSSTSSTTTTSSSSSSSTSSTSSSTSTSTTCPPCTNSCVYTCTEVLVNGNPFFSWNMTSVCAGSQLPCCGNCPNSNGTQGNFTCPPCNLSNVSQTCSQACY